MAGSARCARPRGRQCSASKPNYFNRFEMGRGDRCSPEYRARSDRFSIGDALQNAYLVHGSDWTRVCPAAVHAVLRLRAGQSASISDGISRRRASIPQKWGRAVLANPRRHLWSTPISTLVDGHGRLQLDAAESRPRLTIRSRLILPDVAGWFAELRTARARGELGRGGLVGAAPRRLMPGTRWKFLQMSSGQFIGKKPANAFRATPTLQVLQLGFGTGSAPKGRGA